MAFALILTSLPAHAVDTTWIFDGDGNWNVPGNWDNGEPVDDTFDVFIDDGDTAVTVTLNAVRTIGNLTIGADDALSINNNIDLHVHGGTITNDGLISLNSVGNATDLTFNVDTLLTGAGTLTMSNNTQNRIFGTAGTEVLTHDLNHTIEGAGQLGVNLIGIVNHGLIDANLSNALTIDPSDVNVDGSGADVRNDGTLQASAGGRLDLGGGVFNNTSGTIQALDLSIVRLASGAHVIGGTFTSAGTGFVDLQSGSTIENITNTGAIHIANNHDPDLVGTITNNGTVEQNSVGNGTDVTIVGNVALTGTGTWTMSNNIQNRIFGAVGTEVLTHGAGHTIEGAGQFGANFMGLINHGMINANQTNAITIDPSDSDVDGTGADVRNDATLQASSGGRLDLGSGVFNNSGGTIQALVDSSVRLLRGAHVKNGMLTSTGTGIVDLLSGSTVEDITNSGTIRIANDQDPGLVGTITNNGTVEQNSVGNNTDVTIVGDVMLTGTGTWTMANNIQNRWYGAVATDILTHTADHTIEGAGQIGIDFMGIINHGVIDANQTNGLTIDPSDVDVDGSDADVLNDGTLQASAGGLLQLGNGIFNNTDGTIQALEGASVRLLSGAHVKNGTLTSVGTGVVELQSGSIIEEVTNNGTYRIPNNHDPKIVGSITNNGTVEQNSGGNHTDVTIVGDVTLTGNGTWTMSNNLNNRWFGADAADVLTNDSNHTLAGEGQMVLPIINNGAIEGASATGLMQLKRRVSGTGSLANVQVEAEHAPGASPAAIPLGGLYTMTSTATLEIEIGGPVPGIEHDRLNSTGDVTIDGTLQVEQIDLGGGVFQPQFGDAFVIITASGDLNGTFDTLNALNLDPIFVYEVFYDYDTDVVTLGIDTFFDADFDFDGDVDGDDFLIWQSGFGTPSGAEQGDGDANEDGAVDGDDFLVWQNQFGGSVGGNGSVGVPEPTAVTLLFLALAAFGLCARRPFMD